MELRPPLSVRLTLCLLITASGIGAAVAQTNTATGQGSLANVTTGTYDSAFGSDALMQTNVGAENTCSRRIRA